MWNTVNSTGNKYEVKSTSTIYSIKNHEYSNIIRENRCKRGRGHVDNVRSNRGGGGRGRWGETRGGGGQKGGEG